METIQKSEEIQRIEREKRDEREKEFNSKIEEKIQKIEDYKVQYSCDQMEIKNLNETINELNEIISEYQNNDLCLVFFAVKNRN